MPETKTPSAGNAIVIYFVNKLERVFDRMEGGYISGESFFPDLVVKYFNPQNNSLTLTPDFFEKRDKMIFMHFGELKVWAHMENISKILIV